MSLPIDNASLTPAGRTFAQIAAQQAAGAGSTSNPILDAIRAQSMGGGESGGMTGPSGGGVAPLGPAGAGGIINTQGQAARGILGGWNDNMWANLPNFGIGYD